MALAEAVAIMGAISLFFGVVGAAGCAVVAVLDWLGLL